LLLTAYYTVSKDVYAETILAGMTNRLKNWSYRDVTNLLKENGFSYQKPLKGSHQAWIKHGENGELDHRVEVSIPNDSYHPKTLRNMIRQSGLHTDVWMKWGGF
jgi:predicted RNA binding protein YcfA (HicA-like mRNA interferase family)